jgi:hypothetical protein
MTEPPNSPSPPGGNDEPPANNPPPPAGQPSGQGGSGGGNEGVLPVQKHTYQPVAARVPERVARGVYSTGQIVLDSPKEIVIDFLQGLTRPPQVAARVVMTPGTAAEFIVALRQNLENYHRVFGPPQQLPPPGPNRPTIQEIYENFKLADDQLSGVYANAVLIGHSITEFFFDFITTFYPTSAVSARVYLPAPMAPRFLQSLESTLQQFQKRYMQPPPPGGQEGRG